jgi:hypothetical protein
LFSSLGSRWTLGDPKAYQAYILTVTHAAALLEGLRYFILMTQLEKLVPDHIQKHLQPNPPSARWWRSASVAVTPAVIWAVFGGKATMPLSRDHIQRTAGLFGFTIQGFEPGPGTRADILLKDECTEESMTICIWPCSSEEDLLGQIGMAAAVLRGSGPDPAGPHTWLL